MLPKGGLLLRDGDYLYDTLHVGGVGVLRRKPTISTYKHMYLYIIHNIYIYIYIYIYTYICTS